MLYRTVMLLTLLIGCNHYDQDKAFPVQPQRGIGWLDVYTPCGWDPWQRQMTYEAIEKPLMPGALVYAEGHWARFWRMHRHAIPLHLRRRVRLRVHDVGRLNGITRNGVLGYYENNTINVTRGEYYELPDLTRQLHRAFLKLDDAWYEDRMYWTIVKGEQDSIVQAFELARRK